MLIALIVGWLVSRMRRESAVTESRAADAERLRDELGRRTDVLEAANRCARALSSSLELDQAFGAFIREVRGLVPFERIAIVLADNGNAQVMAVAGAGSDEVFPPGTARPIEGSLLEEILRRHEPVYRRDIVGAEYPEEQEFLDLGLRCRARDAAAAGHAGDRDALARPPPRPTRSAQQEIELGGLLGRLVASAVQNIRAYEAERKTVEELRRLSALRADFVSLVSHELRTPMASVIGSARTLQQRWRELTPGAARIVPRADRRRDEPARGADRRRPRHVADRGRHVQLPLRRRRRRRARRGIRSRRRRSGSDEVAVRAEVRDPLPRVRGDAERLRQVLTNLIDNAIKYSPAGDAIEVRAYADDGHVRVDVSDNGPGVAREDQRLIFEKFGRVTSGNTRSGTGLGLFIARSIAEAHGGTLDVHSVPQHGATFTLALPGPG